MDSGMTTNTLCSVHSTKAISRALMTTIALMLITVAALICSAPMNDGSACQLPCV